MRTLSTLLAGSNPSPPHATTAATIASARIMTRLMKRLMSQLPSHADARQKRDARRIRAQRLVVVVADALDVRLVVGVVDVEIEAELEVLRDLPRLVDAHVELVKRRVAVARRREAGERNVGAHRRIVEAVGLRRDEAARD